MTEFATSSMDFSDLTGPDLADNYEDDRVDPNFECELRLEEITEELSALTQAKGSGDECDDERLDFLLKAQANNLEFQRQMDKERLDWREQVFEICTECLDRTRSYVPVDVFSASVQSLEKRGIDRELARRMIERRCLWLVRMSTAEIARLHPADLYQRFNPTGQHMDMVEMAAIYASLPEVFVSDETGKKKEWRDMIEDMFRQMMLDNEQDKLTIEEVRNPAYNGLKYGPIKDRKSLKPFNFVHDPHAEMHPKVSFKALCKSNSILFKASLKKGQDIVESNELDDMFE